MKQPQLMSKLNNANSNQMKDFFGNYIVLSYWQWPERAVKPAQLMYKVNVVEPVEQ